MEYETLRALIRQNGRYVLANARGITQEESLRPSPGSASPFNWILGHLCYWRNSLLQIAGVEPVWVESEGDQYRGSPGKRRHLDFPRDRAFSVGRLVADFEAMQQRLEKWTTGGERTDLPEHFLDLLFHEAYHAGQLAILRRSIGREGVF